MAVVEPDQSAIVWQSAAFGELGVEQLYQILRLRQDVFILEQSCLYSDIDSLDQQAMHLSAWQEGRLLAYLRALPPGVDFPESCLGRVVVSHHARGLNLGRELIQRGIALNMETWPGAGICLSAQAHLERLYRELGFVAFGDVYDDEGSPHIKMRYQED